MTVPTGDLVQSPGLCTRCINYDERQRQVGVPERLCGEAASMHVAYDAEIENGFCCEAHWVDFQERWVYWDAHPVVAPPCGYPGSFWNAEEKRCDWPADHPLASVRQQAEVPS